MKAMTRPKTYHRWALKTKASRLTPAGLLGPYCWAHALDGGLEPVRTFRTREQARKAKKDCCYRTEAQPVKVTVTIKEAL